MCVTRTVLFLLVIHRPTIFSPLINTSLLPIDASCTKTCAKISFQKSDMTRYDNFYVCQLARGPFFFFFFPCFETTEICLGSTKMDNFTGKNHISRRKKSAKLTLPLKYIPLTPLLGTEPM